MFLVQESFVDSITIPSGCYLDIYKGASYGCSVWGLGLSATLGIMLQHADYKAQWRD